MTYEEAIAKQVMNGKGIYEMPNGSWEIDYLNLNERVRLIFRSYEDAFNTLVDSRCRLLRTIIVGQYGRNLTDAIVLQENYIIFPDGQIFNLYGKPITVYNKFFGGRKVKLNGQTFGYDKLLTDIWR